MFGIKQSARLLRIAYVWMKYGLDEVIFDLAWLRSFRFLVFLNPMSFATRKKFNRGQRLRMALESLGPIFVKFGQLLSTRPDLLPSDLIVELSKLQDQVPPISNELAYAQIEKALGQPISEVFIDFSEAPLASASIAQVHAAKLQTGQEVVIKVLRPHIKKILKKDIALLYSLAKLTQRYHPEGGRLRPIDVVHELEKNIFSELDLHQEAANASILRKNAQKADLLHVPEIHWAYCRKNMLVMERVYGLPVSDVKAFKANDVDLKCLAERGVEIFYSQFLEDCFFHADMHPGNIFVDINDPKDPKYICVDFGIVGSLTDEDQHYLACNFLAFFQRDYRRVAKLHIESGWVPQNTSLTEFETAIRTVCEPIFERPLKDISFGHLLLRLFQIAKRFKMEVQPQLLLLQKTLLNIEGLGRELYPDLDLWQTAKPFIENWMQKKVGVKGLWDRLKREAPEISERLPEIPSLVYSILSQQERVLKQERLKNTLKNDKITQTKSSKFGPLFFVAGLGSLGLMLWGNLVNISWQAIADFAVSHSLSLGLGGALCVLLGYILNTRGETR